MSSDLKLWTLGAAAILGSVIALTTFMAPEEQDDSAMGCVASLECRTKALQKFDRHSHDSFTLHPTKISAHPSAS